MWSDSFLDIIHAVHLKEWLTRADASTNWDIHKYYHPCILARGFEVSLREFRPEISDDHMVLGDEGGYNGNRHVTLNFACNCSRPRQTESWNVKMASGKRRTLLCETKNAVHTLLYMSLFWRILSELHPVLVFLIRQMLKSWPHVL
jgi:hypothetical protein